MVLNKDLRTEYWGLWSTMDAQYSGPLNVEAVDFTGLVELKTGVPGPVVYAILQLECGGRLDRHLHNGDPLIARTTHVPKGRPRDGTPPFTWLDSAIDAVGSYRNSDWSIPGTLFFLEKYNGWGYRNKGINTPYLWSGSCHYTKGKYVADGRYDPEAVSKQTGAALYLRKLIPEWYGDIVDVKFGEKHLKVLGLQSVLNWYLGNILIEDGWAGAKTDAAHRSVFGNSLPRD